MPIQRTPAPIHPASHALHSRGLVRLDGLANANHAESLMTEALTWLHNRPSTTTEWDGRLLIPEPLTFSQSTVKLSVDRDLLSLVGQYLGPGFALSSANVWHDRPDNSMNECWVNQSAFDPNARLIPPRLRLLVFLTDVNEAVFKYVCGTQARHDRPGRPIPAKVESLTGVAGTAYLFDPSGVHRRVAPERESVWVLELEYRVRRAGERRAFPGLRVPNVFTNDLDSTQQLVLYGGGHLH